jgi:hypothetical protein
MSRLVSVQRTELNLVCFEQMPVRVFPPSIRNQNVRASKGSSALNPYTAICAITGVSFVNREQVRGQNFLHSGQGSQEQFTVGLECAVSIHGRTLVAGVCGT